MNEYEMSLGNLLITRHIVQSVRRADNAHPLSFKSGKKDFTYICQENQNIESYF